MLFALSWRLAVFAISLGTLSVLAGLVYARGLSRLGRAEASAGGALNVGAARGVRCDPADQILEPKQRHVEELERDIKAVAGASFRRTIYAFAVHPITDVTATVALAAIFMASLWLHGGDAQA